MATGGVNIPSFREEDEDWSSYLERLDCYFTVKEVKDERKVHTLIVGLQPSQYQVLKDLVAPDTPISKSYDYLTGLLRKHYGGTKNPRVERSKFRNVIRNPGETLQSYAVRLKHAARDCSFGAALNEMLVDQMIAGVHSKCVASKLLEASAGLKLTFVEAMELAEVAELNESNALIYAQEKGQVNIVTKKDTGTTRVPQTLNFQDGIVRRCYRCNSLSHLANKCKFIRAECRKCHKVGHIAVACRSGKVSSTGNSLHSVDGDEPTNIPVQDESGQLSQPKVGEISTVDEYSTFNLYGTNLPNCINAVNGSKYIVNLNVNESDVNFELDTGAAVTCVGENTFQNMCGPGVKLQKAAILLTDYNKCPLDVAGVAQVRVKYGNQSKDLPLFVIKGERASLLGRNWLCDIKLDWKAIIDQGNVHSILNTQVEVEKILQQFETVFNSDLGCLKDFEVSLKVKKDAVPVYKVARTVPYSMRKMVEDELLRLESIGVITPVTYSEWASPTVNVVKSDGHTVRICADFKETLNPVCDLQQYPLPVPEDIFAALAQGQYFTKLDLSHAYHQLKVDEESKKYMVINTHKGLFAFNRLQYGLNCAVGIFQRAMENVLRGIPNVAVYLDDLLITGPTVEAHLETLKQVLQRLASCGLKLKKEKCSFMNEEVTYLGHKISSKGIHTSDDKVAAVLELPRPVNRQELSTFCGIIKYYHRFLPCVSDVLAPLYALEKEKSVWKWGTDEEAAYKKAKELLVNNTLLVHYDPSRPLYVTCDASSFGIGAVLEQKSNGVLRPVSYASRTLTVSERNYSQTEKEGLAVVWAITKFNKYVYGRHFEVWTDHKPLLGLLGEKKGVPTMASGRIIRWSLLLSGYDYTLCYKPGCHIPNADCLSRMPIKGNVHEPPAVGEEVMLVEQLDYSCVKVVDIRHWTDRDPVLSVVRNNVLRGWNDDLGSREEFKPYYGRRNELSVMQGCLLWGNRVVIPPQGRDKLTEELHDTHPGIVRMKGLARSYMWWPNIDRDLEHKVSTCMTCQQYRNSAIPLQSLHPWEFPNKPWSRVHVDYAGPIDGRMYLIVIDAYSKWLEVIPTYGCTSKVTISKLRSLFCTHGLPDILVSDNGPCFTSDEFLRFVSKNGIRHITGAPYHPSTNGLAENAVKTFKQAFKKCEGNEEERINRVLFDYRITPHSTTGVPPCELLMKRQLKSRFDLLRPDINDQVVRKQEAQARYYKGKATKSLTVKEGDHVYFKNFSKVGPPNVPGIIEQATGPVSCLIRTDEGALVARHHDQMFKQAKPRDESHHVKVDHFTSVNDRYENVATEVPSDTGSGLKNDCIPDSFDNSLSSRPMPALPASDNSSCPLPKSVPELRRSSRMRKTVERLNL